MRGSLLSLGVLGLLETACPAGGVCSWGSFPGEVESLRVLGLLETGCPAWGVCSGGSFPGMVEVNPCPWKTWFFLQLAKVSLWPSRPSWWGDMFSTSHILKSSFSIVSPRIICALSFAKSVFTVFLSPDEAWYTVWGTSECRSEVYRLAYHCPSEKNKRNIEVAWCHYHLKEA